MQLMTIRRPPLAILLAVLTLVASFALVRVDRVATHGTETVVDGPWGAEAEAFGRARGPDGRESGPRSFAVDRKGHIFVADTFNGRVKEYDAGGRLLRQFAVGEGFARKPFLEDLTVTPAGHIYLADNAGGTVLKVDRDGRLLATFNVRPAPPPEGLWRIESLAPGPDDGVYVLGMALTDKGYTASVRLFSETGALRAVVVEVRLDATGQPLGKRPGSVAGLISAFTAAGNGRLVLMTAGETPFQRGLHVVPTGGGQTRRWLYESSTYIEEASLLGADRSGHVYLGANLSKPDGWVVRLDGDGQVQEVIGAGPPQPGRGSPAVLFGGRVGQRGDIFLARPTADRFVIVRLSSERHIGFRPVWRQVTGPR